MNPLHLLKRLRVHRELIFQFIWWEIQENYRGAAFGLIWLVLIPLLRLAVYTIVFSFLLGGNTVVWRLSSDLEVAMMIFSGLIFFGVFSETMGQSPHLMWSYKNYVKNIKFPLDILSLSITGAAILHSFVGVSLLLIMKLVVTGELSWSIFYLPLVYLPLVFLTVGVSWIFTTIGVFWRDIAHITQNLIQLLLFLSAIVYPLDCLLKVTPEHLHWLPRLNPLTTIIEDSRRILLKGLPPDWFWFTITLSASLVFMVLSYACFMRSQRSFADII